MVLAVEAICILVGTQALTHADGAGETGIGLLSLSSALGTWTAHRGVIAGTTDRAMIYAVAAGTGAFSSLMITLFGFAYLGLVSEGSDRGLAVLSLALGLVNLVLVLRLAPELKRMVPK